MDNHVLLTNGHVVDVDNGRVEIRTIEIKEGMIRHIYSQKERLPTHIRQIDVEGKYLIPGLIDMHCHIKRDFATHFVAAGVTTVRNTAGDLGELKPLIEAPIDAPTPGIYASDWLIDGEPGLWGPTGTGNFVTDDKHLARKEVRRQAKAGAQFIKVYGLIKKEVMRAVVEEAKKYHLEVSCDLHHSKNIDALTAAKLGITWFEHASGFAQGVYPNWHLFADQENWNHINWLEPDKEKIKNFCEHMLTFNVKLCPTLIVTDQAERLPNYWDPANNISTSTEKIFEKHWKFHLEHIEDVQKQIGFLNAFTKKVAKTYADLGGTVVAGTDTPALPGIFPGMALHRELELFVEIGFTPLQALQAATITAARSINLNNTGIIAEGNVANILVLGKNPLENISHTQSIDHIIKGGKWYSQNECLSEL